MNSVDDHAGSVRDAGTARRRGPGGRFEAVEEHAHGTPMRVFRNRRHSLREPLASAQEHGDAESLVNGDRRWTGTGHHHAVASLSRAFRERHGIGPGDRTTILSPCNAEWILSASGTSRRPRGAIRPERFAAERLLRLIDAAGWFRSGDPGTVRVGQPRRRRVDTEHGDRRPSA